MSLVHNIGSPGDLNGKNKFGVWLVHGTKNNLASGSSDGSSNFCS